MDQLEERILQTDQLKKAFTALYTQYRIISIERSFINTGCVPKFIASAENPQFMLSYHFMKTPLHILYIFGTSSEFWNSL